MGYFHLWLVTLFPRGFLGVAQGLGSQQRELPSYFGRKAV